MFSHGRIHVKVRMNDTKQTELAFYPADDYVGIAILKDGDVKLDSTISKAEFLKLCEVVIPDLI